MRKFVLIMLAVSLAMAGGISYFASPHPDGLERVAEKLGFTREGVLREELLIRGNWVDHTLYSMLEGEFCRTRNTLPNDNGGG